MTDVDLSSSYYKGRKLYPAMTTRMEQHLYSQTAGALTGAGCVVDLGTWMGSTTEALARGLTQPVKIHAYDRYIWANWMEKSYPRRYKEGESFLEEFKERIEPWKDKIEIYPGDLKTYKWSGEPIELLLVDAMKTLDLANHIAQEFYPALVPGAYLLHQDFFHYYTAWIHPLQYRLREYFTPVGSTDSTFMFRCIKTPREIEVIEFDAFSEDELEAAFAWSHTLAGSFIHKVHIELARRCWQLHKDLALGKPYAQTGMTNILAMFHHQFDLGL